MTPRQVVTAATPQRLTAPRRGALVIHLPEPPSVNHYYTVARGRKILSQEGRQYKEAVRLAWAKQFRSFRVAFPTGAIVVTMVWHRGKKIGDLDNRWKACLDALKGLAWADDAQIVEQHGYRREEAGHPHVTLTVSSCA